MMAKIYMDYAASTPMREEVVEVMKPYFAGIYGNPSSLHEQGQKSREAIENARMKVSRVFNCSPGEIIFTAGGTESCNMAIFGVVRSLKSKGNHIITSSVEHEAVLEPFKQLEREGFKVTYLPVDQNGLIAVHDFEAALTDQTIFASIMYANNEVGTIQPIKEIGKICRERGIISHTDACQAVGFLDFDVKKLNVDMISVNGSKIYGPKQIGCLYARAGIKIQPIMLLV
jgi:cysteine desulfurase